MAEINWIEITGYILTVLLGALSVYLKRSAAAQKKSAEIENWLLSARASAEEYIARAEKEFKGTQRGGEKFEWVVSCIFALIPEQLQRFITRNIIAETVQAAFDCMADYASAKLDRALSGGEGKACSD